MLNDVLLRLRLHWAVAAERFHTLLLLLDFGTLLLLLLLGLDALLLFDTLLQLVDGSVACSLSGFVPAYAGPVVRGWRSRQG